MIIKKIKKELQLFILIQKRKAIRKANIKTSSVDLLKLLESDIKESKEIVIESVTNEDQTSAFFQELLIGGGNFFVNNKKLQILGPINSKVRLEYLFCTGEMFLPNYN